MSIVRIRDNETLLDVLKKLRFSFPERKIIFDSSLGFRMDLFGRMEERDFFTIRYNRNGNIRIPTTARITMYANNERSLENERGYIKINDYIVCNFSELSVIMTSPELGFRRCSDKNLAEEISKLRNIYGEIPEQHPVTVYFLDKVISEEYWFNFLLKRSA